MRSKRRQGWGDTFVFFKHEDGATGPKLAAELLELGAGSHAAAP